MYKPLANTNNKQELDFERIRIFYANSHIGYMGFAAGVLFLYFVVYYYSSPKIASMWVAFVFISYLPRIISTIIFKIKLDKKIIVESNIRPWEQYSVLNSIPPYLCFSAVIFLPYQENTSIAILYCAVVFLGLIAGGVLVMSTVKAVIISFMNITLLPLIVKCFWMQTILFNMLGGFLIVGYMLVMRLIYKQNKILLENITLRIENKNQSLKDSLTNLSNRRRLYLYIEQLIPVSDRSGEPFSIIMLDIDYFKQYNDTYGHSAGDDLLIEVSNILKDCSREQDLVVRYGGEEFMLVLPATNTNQTKIIAERIRTTIKKNTNVTISLGLAVYTDKMDFDQLVRRADEALYVAKAGGKNKLVVTENI